MKTFKIRDREVGIGCPPLIFAELGINHEGSLQTAFEMVDAAARAGVEVLKHQTHIVEDEMSLVAKKIKPGNAQESIYEIIERCSLSEEDEIKLKRYVESKGMIFISTPFSRAAADRLQRMDVPAFKIGSGECNNIPLLEHIASFGKPMILSTGMNTIESVRKSVAVLQKFQVPFALLHTTNLYPTPYHLVRLGALTQLMSEFPDTPVGLSDHTVSNHACLAATALGASILERHFTDRMDRPGPDIVCSMDESETRDLIEGVNVVFQMLGGQKGPALEEQVTIDFAFATICTIKPIAEGEEFTKENIWVKRPGKGGILAEHYEAVLGKKATQALDEDVQVSWENIK